MAYEEVFEPVAKYSLIRFLLSLKVLRQYRILQLEVKNEFLKGTPTEEIYLELPNCVQIDAKKGDCLRLRNTLYGLKQAARAWNENLEGCVIELGFKKSHPDASLFLCDGVYLLVYVDNVLMICIKRKKLPTIAEDISRRLKVHVE